MEKPPRVDLLLARAVDQQVHEQRSWREALEGMEERLEALEETVAGLDARLRRWSDPGEVVEQVSGLEEEISVALGRFYKRLEGAATSMEESVRTLLSEQVEAMTTEFSTLTAELQALGEDLGALPDVLAEHRARLARDLKKPVRSYQRRSRRDANPAEA
jgi:hypothetical protein